MMEDKSGVSHVMEESQVDVQIKQTKAQPQLADRPNWTNGKQLLLYSFYTVNYAAKNSPFSHVFEMIRRSHLGYFTNTNIYILQYLNVMTANKSIWGYICAKTMLLSII